MQQSAKLAAHLTPAGEKAELVSVEAQRSHQAMNSSETLERIKKSRPPKTLRILFFILGIAGVGIGIFFMSSAWDELNRLEAGHKDNGTLHIEFCPNLNVYAASGTRFNDILRNFHYHSYEFKNGDESVTLYETKLLNILDRVGVRFLSWGLVRLHSLQINVKFVQPKSVADAVIETWSDTSRQWTLVATGSPVSERCEQPELFNVVRYLLQVVSRHGFLVMKPRENMFKASLGIFIEDEGEPTVEALRAPEVWGFLAFVAVMTFVVCAFLVSIVDTGIIHAYRNFVTQVLPMDTPDDSLIFYSAGPIFIADHIDTGIMRDAPVTDALYGAIRMLIAIIVPTLPFYPLLAFSPTNLFAWIVTGLLGFYLLISAVYGIVYISEVPWSARRHIAWAFYVTYAPLVVIASLCTISWIIWLLVFVSYDPVSVGTILVVVASTVSYTIFAAQLIVRILNATELPSWLRTLDEDITKQELAQYVLRTSVVVLLLAGLVFSGWILATPADERTPETTANIVMACIVPMGQYIASLQMRHKVDNTLEAGTRSQTAI